MGTCQLLNFDYLWGPFSRRDLRVHPNTWPMYKVETLTDVIEKISDFVAKNSLYFDYLTVLSKALLNLLNIIISRILYCCIRSSNCTML